MSDSNTGTLGSLLPEQTNSDLTALELFGEDLTKPVGSRNRKINAAGLLAYFLASIAPGGSGGTPNCQYATGIAVPAGGFVDTVMYAPVGSSNDVVLLGLQLGQSSLATQPFYFEVWAGSPTGTGVRVYASEGVGAPVSIVTASAYLQSSLYIPKAQGSTKLYLRVYNTGFDALTYAFQCWCLEFAGNGIVLPQYEDPAPYLGPLLSTVHVGPGEQFTEPRYGMQALADGGTMYVDAGHYYLPFGIAAPAAGASLPANFGTTSANAPNRFVEGVSIIGVGAYQTIFDGRGGLGQGFRMTFGKAYLYTQAPALVQGIQFISCGGDVLAQVSTEAALYPESFPTAGTLTVQSCAFDNNANGIQSTEANPASGSAGANTGVNVTIEINDCDFGLEAPNGVTTDGESHDFYLNCAAVVVNGCNFYGSNANCCKSRSPSLTINNSWIRRNGDRCIDYPNGGSLTVTGTTLLAAESATTNFFEYGAEIGITGWANTISNPQFNNCTVINTRYAELIWMNEAAPVAFDFNSCEQQYYTYLTSSAGAPFLVFNRDGGDLDNDASVCTGLTSGVAGTVLTSLPVPGSVAAPGYTPSTFSAWNGTV